jgi:hypothetical protein
MPRILHQVLEGWIAEAFPIDRTAFRVDEFARKMQCSVEHVFKLIKSGCIVVPQENLNRASSRASILMPRKGVVMFLRERSSPNYFKRHRRKAANRARRQR